MNDAILYQAQIEDLIREDIDSAAQRLLIERYVDQWTEEQVRVQNAKNNLDEASLEKIEKQLDDYRSTLLIHAYEEQVVRDLVDTNIVESELLAAYDQNKENFKLKSDIYQVYYLKVSKSAPNLNQVKSWLRGISYNYNNELRKYASKFAVEHSIEEDLWVKVEDIENWLPEGTNPEAWLRTGRFKELTAGNHRYLIKVNEVKIEQAVAPLEFVKEDVVKIILRKRIQDFLQERDRELMINARKNGSIQTFQIRY